MCINSSFSNSYDQVPILNFNSYSELPELFQLRCGLRSCVDILHYTAILLCQSCLVVSILTRDRVLATLESRSYQLIAIFVCCQFFNASVLSLSGRIYYKCGCLTGLPAIVYPNYLPDPRTHFVSSYPVSFQ